MTEFSAGLKYRLLPFNVILRFCGFRAAIYVIVTARCSRFLLSPLGKTVDPLFFAAAFMRKKHLPPKVRNQHI